jgi:hypothetical protein
VEIEVVSVVEIVVVFKRKVLEVVIVVVDSAVAVAAIVVQYLCTRQYVMNVRRTVKFHSVHQETSQYTVLTVSEVKKKVATVLQERILEIVMLVHHLVIVQLHVQISLLAQLHQQMTILQSNYQKSVQSLTA